MPEQHRHLVNKCEDIVNLQGAEACVATRPACLYGVADKTQLFRLSLVLEVSFSV